MFKLLGTFKTGVYYVLNFFEHLKLVCIMFETFWNIKNWCVKFVGTFQNWCVLRLFKTGVFKLC